MNETHLSVDVAMIVAEYREARAKHGPMNSPHEGWAVIKEELDELWALVMADEGDTIEAYDEAKQIAAMGLAYMMEVAP